MKGISPAALGAALSGNLENVIAATTPGGIERQEAEGQRQLVSAEVSRLPKDINDHRFRGKTAAEVYALAGIEVIGDCDDIFLSVKLPEGWKLQATDHSMHSDLLDEQGRKRAGIFYKAAFYDRNAHFHFNARFRAGCEPADAYKSSASYEERKQMKRFGRVYDGDTIVFESEGREPIQGVSGDRASWEASDQQEKELRAEAESWLVENGYPDFNDPLQYW